MNTSRIIVRFNEAQRTAELEIKTPHEFPRIQGWERALQRIGVRPLHTIELSTRRHSITRAKLVELDGSRLDPTRVLQILGAAQEQRPRYLNRNRNVA